jgi:hypothetical protein
MSALGSATEQLEQLAAAMVLGSTAQADQAANMLAAQRAAALAADERFAALSEMMTQLQAQFVQYRAQTDAEITVLEGTVERQSALIETMSRQFAEHLRAYSSHTHGADCVTIRPSSPPMQAARFVSVTRGKTTIPQ